MAFLFNVIELVLLGIVALDTLGYIAENRKHPVSRNQQDYLRLCYTWVFFFALRALPCFSWLGFIGSIIGMLQLMAKVYISIPALGGTEKMYRILIEENMGKHYLSQIFGSMREKNRDSIHSKKQE
jgi:hypothetical protein